MNKRWKPHFNERYYSVGNGGVLEPGTWLNDFVDIAMYKLGNCYATPEEAEANMEKWIKWYSSDDKYSEEKTVHHIHDVRFAAPHSIDDCIAELELRMKMLEE